MRDLRLIGVQEDGQHLLLASDDGGRFRLPLDEALRAAARRDRPRLGQLQIEIDGGLRPREVQALIRQGLTAEEVADRAGWTIEKVRRFEGPVLAEREFIAASAQKSPLGSGRSAQTLGHRVDQRLRDRGVEREDVEWDSARDEDGHWAVSVAFPAGGRRRLARWAWDHLGGTVAPLDDEARWLSEDVAEDRPIPVPHMPAEPPGSQVFDIEASGGLSPRPRRPETPATPSYAEAPIDLMAAMREHSARGRRGRRRHSPSRTPGDDHVLGTELPLLDVPDPAEGSSGDLIAGSTILPAEPEFFVADAVLSDEDTGDGTEVEAEEATVAAQGTPDPTPEPAAVEGTADPEPPEPAPLAKPEPDPGSELDQDTAAAHEAPADTAMEPSARRSARPRLPSWDDIMFGARSGGG